MHEHAVRADLLELGADLLFDVAAENDLGRGVDGKIQHGGILPFLYQNHVLLLYLYPCQKSKYSIK